jgi:hypothetical protein
MSSEELGQPSAAVRVAVLWYFFEMDADERLFTMAAWRRLRPHKGSVPNSLNNLGVLGREQGKRS